MTQFNDEKVSALKRWEEYKQTLMRPVGAKGGRGYVDPEIVPLCDALNQLDGIYTLQSCAGHSVEESDGAIYSGELWLRFDKKIRARFEIQAHCLSAEPMITRVGKIYWEDGKETVTISFKGNESNLLIKSSAVVLTFFKRLCN